MIEKHNNGMRTKKIKDTIFFITLATIPLLVLAFNYIFINANSLLLAFKEYELDGSISWVAFKNFKDVIMSFKTDPIFPIAMKRSLLVYFITLVVTTLVPILFTYYMYKRNWGSGVFKVILFLPSVVSSVVLVIIYKFLCDLVIPQIAYNLFKIEMEGLISNKNTKFATILIYKLWMMFGGGMLVQLAAMNSVDKNVVEAGKLDGLSYLGELWHVVLPHSYSVISLGFITGIVSIFTDDFGLYAFFGENAGMDIETIGYYFLVRTKRAEEIEYPFLAAWGLWMSFVAIPLTFLARWAVYKFGASED